MSIHGQKPRFGEQPRARPVVGQERQRDSTRGRRHPVEPRQLTVYEAHLRFEQIANIAALLERHVVDRTQDVVATYDREVESRALSEDVRNAIVATGLAGVGAVGLGALLLWRDRRRHPDDRVVAEAGQVPRS